METENLVCLKCLSYNKNSKISLSSTCTFPCNCMRPVSSASPLPLLNDICCSFEGWPDPPHLPIEPPSWIFYECLLVQVCVCVRARPSAASIAISAAAGVIVPQWLQCKRRKKPTLSDHTLQRAIWREGWSEDTERKRRTMNVREDIDRSSC